MYIFRKKILTNCKRKNKEKLDKFDLNIHVLTFCLEDSLFSVL